MNIQCRTCTGKPHGPICATCWPVLREARIAHIACREALLTNINNVIEARRTHIYHLERELHRQRRLLTIMKRDRANGKNYWQTSEPAIECILRKRYL